MQPLRYKAAPKNAPETTKNNQSKKATQKPLKCPNIPVNLPAQIKTSGSIPALNNPESEPAEEEDKSIAEEVEKKESVSEVFKERLAQYKKTLTKTLGFSDTIEIRNPQFVSEFAQDIYTTMREQEMVLKINENYLSKM